MNILEFIIALLATYRITSLLQREVGPWELCTRIRKLFGVVHDTLGHPHGYPDTLFGKLFECFWCLSVWVAAGVSAVVWLNGGAWVLLPFALSGGAILCVEVAEK